MTDIASLESLPQYAPSNQYQADGKTGSIILDGTVMQSQLTHPTQDAVVYHENRESSENVTNIRDKVKLETEPSADKADLGTAEDPVIPQLETPEDPVIDIAVNNVVCVFNTRCHLNLKRIAMEALNVEFRRENGMCLMKIRHPKTTASMWSSGKITCTGSTSEEEAKIAARKFARLLQKLGFRVRFTAFRVVNVLATCIMPFAIRINEFSRENYHSASYEPELHPAVTYRIKSPKATLKIFSTGSITVTAPRVCNIQSAIEHIFPLVYQFKMEKKKIKPTEIEAVGMHAKRTKGSKARVVKRVKTILDDESDSDTTDSESDIPTDQSFD